MRPSCALTVTLPLISRRSLAQQKHKRDFQSIVVSHKDTLYHRADSVIGIYRDAENNCSRVLSLDLDTFAA